MIGTYPYQNWKKVIQKRVEAYLEEELIKFGTDTKPYLPSNYKSYEELLQDEEVNQSGSTTELITPKCGACKGLGNIENWSPVGTVWVKCYQCNGNGV